MQNRNAYIGKNVETLFKNSIKDQTDLIKQIKNTKADPTHPDNNIQLKLKVNKFILKMAKLKISQYSI